MGAPAVLEPGLGVHVQVEPLAIDVGLLERLDEPLRDNLWVGELGQLAPVCLRNHRVVVPRATKVNGTVHAPAALVLDREGCAERGAAELLGARRSPRVGLDEAQAQWAR